MYKIVEQILVTFCSNSEWVGVKCSEAVFTEECEWNFLTIIGQHIDKKILFLDAYMHAERPFLSIVV